MLSRSLVALSLLASLLGFAFTATSTSDFARHLDRQVHALHCSFVPGAEPHAEDTGEPLGCRVALMSPYSSVARRQYWGGVPVSLPGVPTFAFLAAWSGFLLIYANRLSRWSALWSIAWWTLPVIASIFMGRIALVELQSLCKMCIGTYVASGVGWLASLGLLVALWWRERSDEPAAWRAGGREARGGAHRTEPRFDGPDFDGPDFDGPDFDDSGHDRRDDSALDDGFAFDESAYDDTGRIASRTGGSSLPDSGRWGRAGHADDGEGAELPLSPLAHAWSAPVAGLALVAALGAWVRSVPDVSAFEAGCGELAVTEDTYEVMVTLSSGPVDAIEILDPLCAACRAFEERLDVSGLGEELGRRALLFPLDAECNWMIGASLHPGACAVTEAILCDSERAGAILEWAFARQDELMSAERARAGAVAGRVTEAFPSTRGCVGSPEARSALHRGLRWAVQNELPVMTPQLFVDGRKLCNEDTDLGLDYMLTRLIERATTGAAR